MKYLYLTVTSITLAYLIINLFIYFYQRNLLYNPSENNYLNDKINFHYKEIFIETDKNIKLKSWFINKDLKKFFVYEYSVNARTPNICVKKVK